MSVDLTDCTKSARPQNEKQLVLGDFECRATLILPFQISKTCTVARTSWSKKRTNVKEYLFERSWRVYFQSLLFTDSLRKLIQTESPRLETVLRLLLNQNCYSQFSCKHLEVALEDHETLAHVPCVLGQDPRVNSKEYEHSNTTHLWFCWKHCMGNFPPSHCLVCY